MPIKRSLSIEKKRGQMSGDESVETKLDSLAKLVKDFTLADKDTPDAAISRIFGKPRKADGTDAGSSVDGDTVNGSDDDTPPYTGRNYQ